MGAGMCWACAFRDGSLKAFVHTGLGTMVIIIVFFLVFFGLMGMQLFATYGRYRCFYNGTDPTELEPYGISVINATAYVYGTPAVYGEAGMIDPNSGGIERTYDGCSPAGGSGKLCSDPYLFNLSETDSIYDAVICTDGGVNPGVWNFDDFGWTSVTLFQTITMVGWTEIQYFMQDATGWYAAVYFLLAVLIGQYVILNLIIAVLGESYEDAVEDAAREAAERKAEKRKKKAKLKLTKSQKAGDRPLTDEQKEAQAKKKRQAKLKKLDCFRKLSPETRGSCC